MAGSKGISAKKKNFREWYEELILKSELIDKRLEHSRGFYGYPPWGSAILRRMEELFENELIKNGHSQIRTPTAFPITLFEKEKEHAEGFAPEVFLVTKGRGERDLTIPKVLRPTGEAVIYPYFRYWIKSYKDLPFKIFETRQSFRAEPTNAVLPLLRSCEFFWIEAHTAQIDDYNANAQVREDMKIFKNVMEKIAVPFMLFMRPNWDKFAGAVYTCAYDSPLPDGKVSQIGTTHYLGTNFAKAFNVSYIDEKNKSKYCHQTSFGIGITKILGTIAGLHGDDRGLILPPAISPIQFVLIPIYYSEKEYKEVLKFSKNILRKLKKFRIKIDDRKEYTPGWKFNEWELKGVPFRIEIGPKEVKDKKIVFVRRLDKKKFVIKLKELNNNFIKKIFLDLTKDMYKRAEKNFKRSYASSFNEIVKKINDGTHLVKIPFCGSKKCADKLKEKTIKVRGVGLFLKNEKSIDECIENSRKEAKGKKCAVCGTNAREIVWVARQY